MADSIDNCVYNPGEIKNNGDDNNGVDQSVFCKPEVSPKNDLRSPRSSERLAKLETSPRPDCSPRQSKFIDDDDLNNCEKKVRKRSKKINNNRRARALKAEVLTTTYHSQISGDKNAIKICIKKANLIPEVPINKRSRKRKKARYSDSENSDFERNSKRRSSGKTNAKIVEEEVPEPEEQSGWGSTIPENLLIRIFEKACNSGGCLPTLCRLSKVCKLWWTVAQTPKLWFNIDLSKWYKARQQTDFRLKWLIENRLSQCQELNLSHWKVNNITLVCDVITEKCSELSGINFCGWNGLTSDHLKLVSTQLKKLQRLDLSSINSETTITKCAIGSQPLIQLTEDMGERLTHLVLANNRLSGFPQIIGAIAANCPNLELLDLSNIKTVSHTTALLNIEKLQNGCEKLRVFRITNSQCVLSSASVKEQVDSNGFPNLEELSVAQRGSTDLITLIDDSAIERILKSSHKLRLLDVRGCTRISDSSLVRVPAWDLEHLFLSGCYVTRSTSSGLELIIQKWSHSLLELDLAWSTATKSLDDAVIALAEKEDESQLRILNLCGSSVSLKPVKAVLKNCKHLNSINLASCRALPRGIKRLYEGTQVAELLASLEEKPKPSTEPPPSQSEEESTDIASPDLPFTPTTTSIIPEEKRDSVIMQLPASATNTAPTPPSPQTNVLFDFPKETVIEMNTILETTN